FTHAAVLPANSDLFPNVNSTAPAVPNEIEFHCSYDRNWTDAHPYFDIKDCLGTIYYMMFEEGTTPGGAEVPKLFVARQTPSASRLGEPQLTPRKYSPSK
ncbi:MAG: hypothetical protein Q9181_006173, partial [Wetmoreana brouardii]